MKDTTKEEFNKRVRFEYYLWRCNDARTYAYSLREMLGIERSKNAPIATKLNHVLVSNDQYFDNDTVIKNLSNTYSKVQTYEANMPNHAPTIIASPEEAGEIIPAKLQSVLKNKATWK